MECSPPESSYSIGIAYWTHWAWPVLWSGEAKSHAGQRRKPHFQSDNPLEAKRKATGIQSPQPLVPFDFWDSRVEVGIEVTDKAMNLVEEREDEDVADGKGCVV